MIHDNGEKQITSKKCVIVLHDSNPYIREGGIEKTIRKHCVELEDQGNHVMVIFPLSNSISDLLPEKKKWNVILDHHYQGIKARSEITELIRHINSDGLNCKVHVCNISKEDVEEIGSFINLKETENRREELATSESTKTENREYRITYSPMLSVVVPVYNTSKSSLDRMLESISNQKRIDESQYEIILIDDGSKQECADYLDVLEHKGKNLRVYHVNNGGVAKARNLGSQLAQGAYVTFVDADDYVAEDFFSKALEIAWKNDADVVYGNLEYVPPIFSLQKQNQGTVDRITRAEIDNLKCCLLNYSQGKLKYTIIGSACGRIFKYDIVQSNPFNTQLKYHEDQIFNRDVLNCCGIAVSTPYTWYYYVQDTTSATHKTNKYNNFFAENEQFFNALMELNEKESFFIRNIARIVNMNYYGAIVLNGYVFSKRPWKTTRKQMEQGMNNPLMQETIRNIKCSWKYMNTIEKIQYFLLKNRMYFVIYLALSLLYKLKR